jgi:hypothetical protein
MPDGFTYVGEWVDGRMEGKGIATFPNGDVYEGSFVDGKREGQGILRYAAGEQSQGEWTKGLLTGPATEPAPDASGAPVSEAPTPEQPAQAGGN